MTKEEILEYFKDINGAYNECTRYDSLKRMLDELEPTCEDAVSREQVLGIVSNPMNIRLDQIIRDLPSVRPIRPKGEWVLQQEENGDDYFEAWDISGVHTYAARYKCSICGFMQICIEDHGHYHFCPNCGADMRGEE